MILTDEFIHDVGVFLIGCIICYGAFHLYVKIYDFFGDRRNHRSQKKENN